MIEVVEQKIETIECESNRKEFPSYAKRDPLDIIGD